MEGHGHFANNGVIRNVNGGTSVIKDRHVVTLTAEDIKRLNVEEVLNGLNGELSVEDVNRLTGGGDHGEEGEHVNGDCEDGWTVGVEVDESPLQNQLKKNKESLKVKLMVRRPMNTLVEQGIMPEYKTSPSLHEKITKLERAKMGDMLKAKIACRPERADLVNRHILEDVRPDVDPSLCERQRQLKRAKLADSLASQLSHRPGPLELIQKNILHTEDDFVEQAVKEGTLQFRPTVEGVGTHWWEPQDNSSTSTLLQLDEDSVSSDNNFGSPSQGYELHSDSSVSSVPALLSRLQGSEFVAPSLPSGPSPVWSATSGPSPVWSTTSPPSPRSGRSESLGDIAAVAHSPKAVICPPPDRGTPRSGSFGGSWSNLSSLTPNGHGVSPSPTSLANGFRGEFNLVHELASGPSLQREAPGKDLQSRKKVKAKSGKPATAPKPRTIKFHEYKGPTASLKRTHEDKADDSSYDLLLKQQQLFLQWQLENQGKFPQILLPAVEKSLGRASIMSLGASSGTSSSQASSSVPSPANSVPGTPRATTPSFRSNTPIRTMVLTPQDVNHATSLMNKLDEMKVTDLKQELKKRNLTVSGSKPALVERLRPVLEGIIAAGRQQFQQPYKQINIPQGGLIILKPSPNSQLLTKPEPNCETAPPTPMHESTPDPGDDIVMAPMTPMAAPLTPIMGNSPCNNPFSPVGMLSPTGSLHNDSQQSYHADSPLDSLLSQGSPAPNMDLDFNLDLMEEDHKLAPPPAPPPPPPPPPPTSKTFPKPTPAPLPPPPNQHHFLPTSNSIQFLPPKTKQQILLAKQQLEAQQQVPSSQIPPTPVRAGPKGQFIWPPVSLQSGQGTVTIRPAQSSQSDTQTVYSVVNSTNQPLLQMSSTPVSQLAAVFSNQTPLPKSVRLPQEPVPKAQLRLSMPVSLNNGTVSLPENVPLPSDNPDPLETSSPVTLTVQLPLNSMEVNKLPMETVNLSQLPATLPLPQHQVKQEPQQRVLTNVQLTPEDTLRVTEDIISQQQHKIEELQTALQRSQQQLQLHQNLLKAEHKKQQSEVKQEPSGGHSSMKMLLAQQLQNKQIASQIQQLQASQIKVQQQQAAVMPFVNCNKQPTSAGSNGLIKSKPKYVIVHDQNTNSEQIHEMELRGQPETAVNNHQDSMDDVLEILIRNGDLPASVAQPPSHSRPHTSKICIPPMFQISSPSQHSASAPPPPPPPPSKHPPIEHPPPPSKHPPMEHLPPPSKHPPMEFPPLDLADLSFDLSQLPELPLDAVTPTDSSQDSGCADSFMDDVMAESMDVDMDVADWLETILPNKNQNASNDMETVTNGSIDLEGPLSHSGMAARNMANANLNMDQLLKWVDGGGQKN